MTDELARIANRLAAPFPATVISWRPGSMTKDKKKAMALAYIDARDVMERLDEVVGPFGWQRRHDVSHQICHIGICVSGVFGSTDEWIWKGDVSGETNIEAEKGGASRAFVRAATNWGIGRYLYDLPSPWMPVDEYKRFTDESVRKLVKSLEGFNKRWETAQQE